MEPRAALGALAADRRVQVALVLAAVSLLVGLGASSLFIDEVYSWQDAAGSITQVQAHVRADEVAPATYFFALNLWIKLFGDAEWVMRLPSALAAIALVAAIAWLARRAAGREAAALAAGLAAVSPLVLQYGQQARGYVFAMLAVTVAAALALEFARAAPVRRRRLYVATLAACVVAFWIHYSSGLVVFVVLAWLATRSELLTRRERLAGVGTAAVLCLVLFGQLRDQLHRHPAGLEGFANFTGVNLAKVLAAPFDGRHVQSAGAPLQKLAAVLCAWALVSLLRRRSEPWAGLRGVAALGAIPVAIMIVRAAGGPDVLTSRYVAVAAPFILIALAAWVVRLPARRAAAAAVVLLAIAVTGTIQSHLPRGRDADARGAIGLVADRAAPGEPILVTPQVGLTVINYYRRHDLPAGFDAIDLSEPDALARARGHRGAWLITFEGNGPQPSAAAARFLGYRLGAQRTFDGNGRLTVSHLVR
jgi:mannosyltransferase